MTLDPLFDLCRADGFMDPEGARRDLGAACNEHKDLARFETIGKSEEGRPIVSITIGRGERKVSLLAGHHSDEPVGPDFLRRLIPTMLRHRDELDDLLARYTFVIIPHTNPDGEARNQGWIRKWPDFTSYVAEAYREAPGRDLEFGFPKMRVENEAVAYHLKSTGPYVLHGSLHGMGVGEGAMLLIERRWGFRTELLQELFSEAVRNAGLPVHDHNRKGEKGFFYLGRGFSTTPEGEAMRWFFRSKGDRDTARLFHQSSMEFVRSIGGDPLCYVTELPLFVIGRPSEGPPGVPTAYLAFRELLPELRLRASRGENIDAKVQHFDLRPVPLSTALTLQLRTLEAALAEVNV